MLNDLYLDKKNVEDSVSNYLIFGHHYVYEQKFNGKECFEKVMFGKACGNLGGLTMFESV